MKSNSLKSQQKNPLISKFQNIVSISVVETHHGDGIDYIYEKVSTRNQKSNEPNRDIFLFIDPFQVTVKSEQHNLSSMDLFWSVSLNLVENFSLVVYVKMLNCCDFSCFCYQGLLQRVDLKLLFGMALKLLINERSFMKKLPIISTNKNLVSFFSFSFETSVKLIATCRLYPID